MCGRLFQAVGPATANALFASRLWVTPRNDVMSPCSRSEAAVGAGGVAQSSDRRDGDNFHVN